MKNYVFTELTKPGQRAIWATSTFGVVQVGLAFMYLYQNAIINRFIDGTADYEALTQSDTLVSFSSIGSLIILLAVYTVNGRFLYLASRNAAAINADPDAISPGWAVGWYLVPIANLWMPFTAMKQTWNRLIPDQGDAPQWLALWWLSWVALNIFDRILGRLPVPDNLPDFITYNQAFAVSGILWVIPTYFFLRIIRGLAEAEHNPAEVFA